MSEEQIEESQNPGDESLHAGQARPEETFGGETVNIESASPNEELQTTNSKIRI